MSIIRPSRVTAPSPCPSASAIAAMIRRALSSSSAPGLKTSLTISIWLGWITHLPSKPRTAERIAAARQPAWSRKSAYGPSIGLSPWARAATASRARA